MSHASESPEELPHAPDDGGKLSIRTIAARLNRRSQVLEIASNEAPEDGKREPMRAVPSPAPVFPKSLGKAAKPSKRRSSTNIVPTVSLHNDADGDASSLRKCSGNRRQGVSTASLLAAFPAIFSSGDRRTSPPI